MDKLMQRKMKRSPDLILILVVAFVIGAIMTGVSQSDIHLATIVKQVFNS